MNTSKTKNKRRWLVLLSISSLIIQAASAQNNAVIEEDEDVYELSPFVIETDENVGYLATSTLAGSRLKTDLKDVGSAISVVTQEFLEDTGSTNAENLLVYTLGTEVGGAQGNFAGSGVAAGNEQANTNARTNPQNNNRVRGLSSAAATRDYFLTAFGFDSYNTESVTISRGPNSILFGIGEPGGIIENSLKKAMFGTDISQVQLRIGQRGTHRETIDFNREIIDGRLALRINAMNERIEFEQQPCYEEDKRWTLAAKGVLFTNENRDWMGPTTVYANFEKAEIRGTPPSTTPPQDNFSHWWKPPSTAAADAMVGFTEWDDEYRANYASQWIQDVIGDATPEGDKLEGQPEMWNSYAITWGDRSGRPTVGSGNDTQVIHATSSGFDMVAPDGSTISTPGWFPMYATTGGQWNNHPGFKHISLMDQKIFNWKKYLLAGRAQYANHDFEAINVTLEQNFFDNKLGFQFAYDKQNFDSESHFPMGRHVYQAIRIDTGAYLPDGTPNPNVGRPLVAGMWDPRNLNEDERISKRLTAYYNLDFTENENWTKWLGNHTVNGLLNSWRKDNKGGQMRLSWDDSHDPGQNYVDNVGKPGSWNGSMFYLAYVGDPQFGAASPSDMRMYQDYLRLEVPKVGDEYTNFYYDNASESIKRSTIKVQEFLHWPSAKRQEIDSYAWTIQSKFLNDHIITTYGWRNDETDTWETKSDNFKDHATGAHKPETYTHGWVNKNGYGTLAEADSILNQTGTTATAQVVAHVPEKWLTWGGDVLTGLSFHYAESENFNPASVRHDVWGDTIGSPSGETEEAGVALTLMDGKAYVRLNWYETTSQNRHNDNWNNKMWLLEWPIGQAQRWLNAKNGSFKGEDALQFEDFAWYGPNGAGPELDETEYLPERLGGFNSFDEVINAFLSAVPEEAGYNVSIEGPIGDQEIRNVKPSGLDSVADSVSKGFEIELVYNITPNWRVAFNASKTESMFSNGLKKIGPYIEQVTANYKNLGLWAMSDDPYEGETPESRWTNSTLVSYNSALAKEGTVNTELRKWRWNLITNYLFREGPLDGFGLGGAIRWADSVSTGYPFIRDEFDSLVPDLKNPWTGESRWDGDVWFSYKTEIKGYPVKFQLNMQNYLGTKGDIPVAHNPDGTLAIIRSAPEKRWFLTTTIDF